MNLVLCYVGLGSNLDNPSRQVLSAMEEIAQLPHTQKTLSSSLYGSAPMGPQDQPHYINAVVEILTGLSASQLLRHMLDIERQHGRVRGEERWTARTLDMDILLYGREVIETTELSIPHPGIAQRNFVLYPLQEIAPQLIIPHRGPIAGLVAGCQRGDLVKLQQDRYPEKA
jgi:2-amino-4-hydroxy-6-hydroxymethyldihydropteridine diphosphokinase